MLQKILLTIVLVLVGPAIMAAESVSNCENTDNVVEMGSCAKKSYLNSNEELNNKLKIIKSQQDITSRSKRLLDKAQKSWRLFRWNYCIFSTTALEGEVGYTFHKFDCLERITRQQIKSLTEYLEGLDV